MWIPRRRRSFCLALVACALAGCNRKPETTSAANGVESTAALVEPAPRASAAPNNWIASWGTFADGVFASRRALDRSSMPREKHLAFPDTAIGEVVKANGGRVPATGRELVQALAKLGGFVQLPVDFSSVALDSGLTRPRVIFTQRPGNLAIPANQPSLEGRLFLAANTAITVAGEKPRVKTIEFISWNYRRLKFDFGVIEGVGGTPELKVLDGARCFSCHKNQGPILGVAPWSNTAHNPSVVLASAHKFGIVQDLPQSLSQYALDITNVEGLELLGPQAQAVDDGVRLGADFLADRAIVKALLRSPVGRDAFVHSLVAIAVPDAPDGAAAKRLLDAADMSRFLYDLLVIRKTSANSRLNDIDPEGLMGKAVKGRAWWSINKQDILRYDEIRAAGDHRLSGVHVPSNPKAFVTPKLNYQNKASDVATATMLAHAMGLTGGDRKFLAESLSDAADAASYRNTWPVTPADLARRIFSGPYFKDVLNGGELPDRDDFKDRFVAGLVEVLPQVGYSGEFRIDREKYASAPRRSRTDGTSSDAEFLPTTACLRCHDVRTPGWAAEFSPIPQLAFDPFDKAGREAWVKSTDRARREAILARMLKRVGVERDMPPSDAAEYELFRVKNPATFDEAAAFLEFELRKARGNR